MDTNRERRSNKEIGYLRFLNGTLKANKLREEVCDNFTRKIFDYLEGEPLFDKQVFCAFIYHFIFKCKLYKNLVMTAETNVYDRIRLDAGGIANQLFLFLSLHTIKFALPSVDPNQFRVSLQEKLNHLLFEDENFDDAAISEKLQSPNAKKRYISWKHSRVKIIVPKMRGNTGIVPYVDLEFTLPPLSVEQKLDVIHFTICALNYLSQKDEPVETFSNPENSSTVLVSKPEHLKVVSDNLISVRDSVILNAIRDKEGFGDDLEFDESLPDIARILIAQSQDPEIEKRWADKNPPVLSKPDSEFIREWQLKQLRKPFKFAESDVWQPIKIGAIEEHSDLVKPETEVGEKKTKKNKGYPPHYLKQIIDTAVRLYEKNDKVRAIDIYTELQIEKNTYNKRIKFFDCDTSMILEKAREIIRERERRKK
jgi:hypothetical protein